MEKRPKPISFGTQKPKVDYASFRDKKILLVDDSSTIRRNMRQILVGYGCNILEAEDGEAAFKMLSLSPDIRLVFCDLNMPILDGLGFVEKVRASGSDFVSVGIIMLTTESDRENVLRGKAAGVLGWLIKPPVPGHVQSCIEKFLT